MFGPAFQARVRGMSMSIMRPVARSRVSPNMLTIVGLLLNFNAPTLVIKRVVL